MMRCKRMSTSSFTACSLACGVGRTLKPITIALLAAANVTSLSLIAPTAMKGMLDPEFEEKITGQMIIRETIKVSKVGTIAGCYVTEGSIKRDSGVRLIREGIVILEGKLASLKRFKDDVKEVKMGFECGAMIENFNDIKVDDVIEGFIMEEIKAK